MPTCLRPSAVAFLLGGLLLGGLFGGCSPAPVYRLSADVPDSTGFWEQGRHVVSRTVDSVQVAVAYARTTGEGHKFRFAFANRSSTVFTVDPTRVRAVVTRRLSEKRRVLVAENNGYRDDTPPEYEFRRDTVATADTLYARNPEQMLLNIDKEQSRAAADARRDAAASAIFLTLDAVSAVASTAQTPDERTADATENTEAQLRRAEKKAENQRTQSRLSQRRARWAQSALRRTTLTPGMRTTGFVVVPLDPDAVTLVLHVDLGSKTVTVPFRQRRYEP
jgi:hypothetical protein